MVLSLGNYLRTYINPAVTPATLGTGRNLQIWFKSDDYVNGANLDNAGALTFTFNPDGTNTPQVDTSTFSGGTTTQGVEFDEDAGDFFLLSAAQTVAGSSGMTIFLAVNFADITNTDIIVAGDSDQRNMLNFYNAKNMQVRFNSDGNTTNAGLTTNVYSTTNDDTGAVQYEITNGDEIFVIRKAEGTEVVTIWNRKKEKIYHKTGTNGAYCGSCSNTGWRLTRMGRKADGGSPAGGIFGDFGVYDEALSDTDVETLIDLMATKFGISQS